MTATALVVEPIANVMPWSRAASVSETIWAASDGHA